MNKIITALVLSLVAFSSYGSASDVDSSDFFADDTYVTEEQSRVLHVPQSEFNNQVDTEYRIGHQDLIDVTVFRADELNRTVRVNQRGEISLPLIGTIKIGGLSVTEAEQHLADKLSQNFMKDPHVSVFIKEYESQKITVNGWVKNPGVFSLKGGTTLMQAISMANGLDRLADAKEVVIFRKDKQRGGTTGYRVDFEEVRAGNISDPLLVKEDIVVVPQNGSKAAFEDTTKTLRTFLGFLPFF